MTSNRIADCSCGYEGVMRLYVGFFKQEVIWESFLKDSRLPKFGFHLGLECPKCGKWKKWLPQSQEDMLGVKFYDTSKETNQDNLI